jgi:hypothetical protein
VTGKVSVKQAMQLARHSDPRLTMARDGRVQLHDLGATVERLPPLVDRPGPQPLRATGTDGNCLPRVSLLAQKPAQTVDSGCERVTAADHQSRPEAHAQVSVQTTI